MRAFLTSVLLFMAGCMSAIGQQVYTKHVRADWWLISTCAEYQQAKRLFEETVSTYELAQKKLTECETVNCASESSPEFQTLVTVVAQERRRREFREARVGFLGQTHKILPIAALHRRGSSSEDGAVSPELSFYLGFSKRVDGKPDAQRFDYLRTSFPALVESPEVFVRKEYRQYQDGMKYRLYVNPEYYRDRFGGRRTHTTFVYSVAGRVNDVCARVDSSRGEVFSIGQAIRRNERFPVGINMNWIVSTKEGGDESNINFFPIMESFFEDAFGMAPPSQELFEKYESSCSCRRCRATGELRESIGQVRRKIGDAMEDGWPTAQEIFSDSSMTFEMSYPSRGIGSVDVAVMIWNVKFREKELGQLEFERFYKEDSRRGGGAWKLQVRSVQVDGVTGYDCRRRRW